MKFQRIRKGKVNLSTKKKKKKKGGNRDTESREGRERRES